MVKRKFMSTLDAGRRSQRKARNLQPRTVILIVCEGQTEEAYFRAIKTHLHNATSLHVKIARDRSDPIKLVERAKRENKDGDYDRVFCVFDNDKTDRTEKASKRIEKRGDIDLILSTPCFEIWLLLHVERSDAPYAECAAVCSQLREHLPDYVKGISYDFKPLMLRLDEAIDNAQWLARLNRISPATNVHHLLTSIKITP